MDYYPTNDEPRHKDPPHILLHRRYVAEILCKIRKEFHWAYSLLRALPPEMFCIRRVYDFTKDWQGSCNYNVPKMYSADEFLRDLADIHQHDLLEVVLGGNTCTREKEFTLTDVMDFSTDFLYDQCEKGLHNNRPLVLTPELAGKYELTDEDRKMVQELLEDFNADITARLHEEHRTAQKNAGAPKGFPR